MVDQQMESWMGRPVADAIAVWGPPSFVTDDGRGGRLMVWQSSYSYTTPGTANTYASGSVYGTGSASTIYGGGYAQTRARGEAHGYGQATTTYMPPQTHTVNRTRSFSVGPDGIIRGWAWRGM